MDNKIEYKIPDGYTVIANPIVLMLVKPDEVGNNPGVHAVCKIADGEQELLRRFYEQNESEE